MTHTETRKLDMLVRVRTFAETHRELLAASTGGAEALATVAAAVDKLRVHVDSKDQAAVKEKEAKTTARAALLASLRAIGRNARMIARKRPGFQTGFRLPRPSKQTDQSLLTAGRNFSKEAATEKDAFLGLGMRKTFIEDLAKRVEAFDAAIVDHESGQDDQTAAQAGITTILADAVAAVQMLNVIVSNQLEDDPIVMAVWNRDRRVDLSRRSRKAAADSTEPAPAATDSTVAVPVPAAAPAVPAVPTVADVAPPAGRSQLQPDAATGSADVKRGQPQPDHEEADEPVGVGS